MGGLKGAFPSSSLNPWWSWLSWWWWWWWWGWWWCWWWWCDVADTLIKWGGRTKGPFSSFSPSLRHSGDTSLITSPQQIQLLCRRSAGEKERKLNPETWSKGYQWQHWYLRSSKSEVDKNDNSPHAWYAVCYEYNSHLCDDHFLFRPTLLNRRLTSWMATP